MANSIDYYLKLPYTIELTPSSDGGYAAAVKELPGCLSQGDTPEEALEMIRDAMAAWIDVALQDGKAIPEPRPAESYSGKFVVRVPKSLHRRLAEEAEAEGVSLNQFINTALAAAAGEISVQPKSSPEKIGAPASVSHSFWPRLTEKLTTALSITNLEEEKRFTKIKELKSGYFAHNLMIEFPNYKIQKKDLAKIYAVLASDISQNTTLQSWLLLHQGDLIEAIEKLSEAVTREKSEARRQYPLNNLGYAYLLCGSYSRADTCLRQIIATESIEPIAESTNPLEIAFFVRGKIIPDYLPPLSRKIGPKTAAYANLVTASLSSENYETAERFSQTIITSHPQESLGYETQAFIALAQGEHNQASSAWLSAMAKIDREDTRRALEAVWEQVK